VQFGYTWDRSSACNLGTSGRDPSHWTSAYKNYRGSTPRVLVVLLVPSSVKLVNYTFNKYWSPYLVFSAYTIKQLLHVHLCTHSDTLYMLITYSITLTFNYKHTTLPIPKRSSHFPVMAKSHDSHINPTFRPNCWLRYETNVPLKSFESILLYEVPPVKQEIELSFFTDSKTCAAFICITTATVVVKAIELRVSNVYC